MNYDGISVKELIDRAGHASVKQRWQEALELADQALSLEPDNYLAQKRRSLALWGLEKSEEAIEAMQRSVELKPDFESGYYNLACYYGVTNNKEQMLASLEKAISLYEDYKYTARDDDDFEEFKNDEDYLALVNPAALESREMTQLFESEDFKAISEALEKVGGEIPLEVIDWEDEDEGANLIELLEEHAERLDYRTLLHLYKLIIYKMDLDSFGAFEEIMDALQEKDAAGFSELIVNGWKERYAKTDAGHMGRIDYQLRYKIKRLDCKIVAELIVWGLKLRGNDALADYEELASATLEKLPYDSREQRELVEIVDTLLHGELYLNDEFEVRARRVGLALPAPDIEVEEDPDDEWARERVAVNHYHPGLVVSTAVNLSSFNNPEALELARVAVPKLCEFILDDDLPVDLRYRAVEVVEKVGDNRAVKRLEPALSDRSVKMLEVLGRTFHKAGVIPEDSAKAVDTILENFSDDPYAEVCALGWYRDPRVVPTLIKTLENSREANRREALNGLAIQKASSAVENILQQLREGSSQCLTAAAIALSEIGGEAADTAFSNMENYQLVLEKVKERPRFSAKALNYFKVDCLSADLVELYANCKEYEAEPIIAGGIAELAEEQSLIGIVALGLDRYKGDSRRGRDYILIARSIGRAHSAGPDQEVLAELIQILKESTADAIEDFAKQLKKDADYQKVPDAPPEEAKIEENYRAALKSAFTEVSSEAAILAESLFSPKS